MTNEMTAKEAVKQIKENCYFASISEKTKQALDMAIKALEQQPCEDCISRQAVDDAIYDYSRSCDVNYEQIMEFIDKLPPVTPRRDLAETSQDCISREAVLDVINFEDEWLFDAKSYNADTKIAFSSLESRVKALPPVTPERPKGKWIRVVDKAGHWVWECDCKWQQRFATNFCPNCGAEMGGEEDG